ncbi:MAG: murein L,D-transpeptidase family protein [Chitinophagales bacterium]
MNHGGTGKAYTIVIILTFLQLGMVFSQSAPAQEKPKTGQKAEPDNLPRPRDVKVMDEHKDKNGNLVRTIQYRQGNVLMTETQIIRPNVNFRVPINPDTLNKDSVMVVVNKSRYTVEVYYRQRKIRSYKAVFGPKPLENKMMAGDRATPEGWFKIQNKNPSSKYHKFMLLNYPNDSSIARFNRLKATGILPPSARIGGDVGIHGVWKGGDDMIDLGVCWTDGCVALKNKDIEELYSFVGIGTSVYIKK